MRKSINTIKKKREELLKLKQQMEKLLFHHLTNTKLLSFKKPLVKNNLKDQIKTKNGISKVKIFR